MDAKEIMDHIYNMMFFNDCAKSIYTAVNYLSFELMVPNDDDIPGFEDRLNATLDTLHKMGEELEELGRQHNVAAVKGLGLDPKGIEEAERFAKGIVETVAAVARASVLLGEDDEDQEGDE